MISIVIPVLNEEESIPHLVAELDSSLKKFNDYEIIFIDDGSTDGSLALMKKKGKKNKNIKVYSFLKNQGKAEALSFGFQKAKGNYIITMDADLQDRPDQIEKMIQAAKKGNDLVCGWRKNRQDSLHTNFSSKVFNILAKHFWGLQLHDYNCGLKIFRKEVAKNLNLYGGLHRFIPLLVQQQGFTVSEIPIVHNKRKFGKSKYGFSKVWKDLPDIFTMLFLSRYGKRPLHFFGFFGSILFLFGIIILGYLGVIKLMGEGIGNRPILFLGILLVLSGLQVFFTGFLADLFINLSYKTNKGILLRYSDKE